MPEYISRADHPYDRKFYAGFEKVVSSFTYVLKSHGWAIINEVDPATFERDDRYDNNGFQNLIIITDVKKHFRVVSSSSERLNVFVHSFGNTCDVEIRYESQTPLVKQFISTKNDKIAQSILDAVEQEINR